MKTAIILINVEHTKYLETSINALRKIEGVTEVYCVGGEHDIVFIMKTEDSHTLTVKLTDEIHSIEGVQHTKTLVRKALYSQES